MSPRVAAALSLAVAFLVLGIKWLAYRATGLVALYSDALESVVNVVAAFGALVAVRISAQPPDEGHPWGHQKVEYVSAGAEGVLIVLAAIAICREAIPRLAHPLPPEGLGTGAALSLFATLLNLGLGLILLQSGRKGRSPAVEADGHHVLTDVFTSGGVLLGLGLARLTGLWLLDPLFAIALAANILYVGYRLLRGATGALMDEALVGTELEELTLKITELLGGEAAPGRLRARRAGRHVFAELVLRVPAEMTVARSHALCDRVEEGLLPDVEVTIHVEPQR